MPLINQSYNYSSEEQNILNENSPSSSGDWFKPCFKAIRHNIKNHLLREQKFICPYCKLNISLRSYPPIEHIVPKGLHINFMFEPLNLAVSCQMCNSHKGSQETLVQPNTNPNYPTNGISFSIVHPWFDEYNDHIELFEDIFIKAKTTKGKKTINICKLFVPIYAEEREKMLSLNKQKYYKQILLRAIETEDQSLIDQINSFIDR